jgi:hypothetical protein
VKLSSALMHLDEYLSCSEKILRFFLFLENFISLKMEALPGKPSASTYKDFSLQKGNIGPCKTLQGIYKEIKFTRKWQGKIKGNCKDFCNLYQLQVLNQ